MIDCSSPAYEARYAADMKAEAMIEAVAQALCDECYGAGTWVSLSSRPEGQGQVCCWLRQARIAVAVVDRWRGY